MTHLHQLLTAAHEVAAALITDYPDRVAEHTEVITIRLAQLDAAPSAREIERFLRYLDWLVTDDEVAA
jgi:hypothetical protein